MKFSGFMQFGALKTNPLSIFREKIAEACENSANLGTFDENSPFSEIF
jgi:hypothetical protein